MKDRGLVYCILKLGAQTFLKCKNKSSKSDKREFGINFKNPFFHNFNGCPTAQVFELNILICGKILLKVIDIPRK